LRKDYDVLYKVLQLIVSVISTALQNNSWQIKANFLSTSVQRYQNVQLLKNYTTSLGKFEYKIKQKKIS